MSILGYLATEINEDLDERQKWIRALSQSALNQSYQMDEAYMKAMLEAEAEQLREHRKAEEKQRERQEKLEEEKKKVARVITTVDDQGNPIGIGVNSYGEPVLTFPTPKKTPESTLMSIQAQERFRAEDRAERKQRDFQRLRNNMYNTLSRQLDSIMDAYNKEVAKPSFERNDEILESYKASISRLSSIIPRIVAAKDERQLERLMQVVPLTISRPILSGLGGGGDDLSDAELGEGSIAGRLMRSKPPVTAAPNPSSRRDPSESDEKAKSFFKRLFGESD